MDLEKLVGIGKSFGLSGDALHKFVQGEQDKVLAAKKLEDDRARDERAHQLELKKLQLELDKVRQSLGDTKSHGNIGKGKSPKLPYFNDSVDDLDAYLQRFERYATSQNWDKDTEWVINLSALLKGKALDVYSRLPLKESCNYDTLKKALFRKYHLTEQGFRQKFRWARPEIGEDPFQFAVRLDNLLTRWVEMAEINPTYSELRGLLIREQFLNACSKELAIFIRERKPGTIDSVTKLAEQYLDAHGGDLSAHSASSRQKQQNQRFTKQILGKKGDQTGQNSNTDNKSTSVRNERRPFCDICKRPGHSTNDCWFRPNQERTKVASAEIQTMHDEGSSANECYVQDSNVVENTDFVNSSETVACVFIPSQSYLEPCCSENGVAKLTCGHTLPIMSAACDNSKTFQMPVTIGNLNGEHVKVLRDSGCSGVVVRQSLVKDSQFTGKDRSCILVDGTVRKVPVAIVHIETPYFTGTVEALCMRNPIYDLIVGNITGARDPKDPDLKIYSKLTKEKHQVSVVQTRGQKLAAGKPFPKLKVVKGVPQINEQDIKQAQRNDPTLHRILNLTDSSVDTKPLEQSHSRFILRNDLLYREFKCRDGEISSQLVVPKPYRVQVMKLAHDSILGGHQGSRKTKQKVLSDFYWPGCQSDISRFCKSCDICQRTTPKGRVMKLPLGSMPLIETPFQRIAVDIVGPIHPKTDAGNRYILTVVDYATRFPEAVPLPSIETTRVAEALVGIFTRVGVPREVLTDRGSQFTSELMKEVGRLLSVKQLTTTPYHPACNGLVERFNGTLKLMLKRMCIERPRDWDCYVNPLLFAYRETPNESTGFSPFELIYGHKVRGPMSILKELWSGEVKDQDVATSYEYVINLRNRLEQTCKLASESLSKSAQRYKRNYDRKSMKRMFKVDDLVLVLLPTDNNKLMTQWRGPYKVVQKLSPLDYRIDVDGSIKTYHANLLKKYLPRIEENTAESVHSCGIMNIVATAVIECDYVKGDGMNENLGSSFRQDNEDLLSLPHMEPTETIADVEINPNLPSEQIRQIKRVLANFHDILTDVPGNTPLLTHQINLTSDEPIRVKQYPLPHATQEVIQKEVEKMLEMDVIERSNSPYCSPVVIVKKKDGSNRFCVDYRRLNRVTIFDAEPMPNPDEIFSRLANSNYFSKLDLSKGYWQIPVEQHAKPFTAFSTSSGLFQFKVLPFGLVNSSATFNRMMRILLFDLDHVDSYIDDILIYTSTWEKHIEILGEILKRLRKANLTIRPSKCGLGMENIEFLGHIISRGKVYPQDCNTNKIQNSPRPLTKKQLRSFLGLAGYYRNFIPNYAAIAAPLTDKTRNKEPNQIIWGDSQEIAFSTLKEKLTRKPILHLPDLSKQFTLRTDASDIGLGAVLLQNFQDELFPVAFASRKLLPRERAYSVMERECLGVVWGVIKFQRYLYGKEFVLQTDHEPLAFMQKSRMTNNRIMRWALALQPYKIRIEAIKGSENVGADFLSRVVN
ncbi:hypothetical protein HOLleu_07148 [Holothuria leucospilota]|uniref:Reverse transcriptase n=1 Tax=Holothuria leucospilota TaxID=206669 RepID=A0A9Q1CGX2_HOLLE|nr:hypothetical protein HOLleu_07148 [Holothuria leucospilota]